jgi:2-octaprenyl-6-methoxyphenol hydroxylase
VHVARPETADELLALDDTAYLARLQAHIGGRARLAGVGPRLRYPLVLRYRRSTIAPRTVWLGNAAQTLHPVAGQGFNLALRDVWALAETLLSARDEAARQVPGATGAAFDAGAARILAAYADARGLDRLGTIRFTDTLVRVFSTDFAPLRHARGAALLALDLLPPLRGFIARRMMFGARAWP